MKQQQATRRLLQDMSRADLQEMVDGMRSDFAHALSACSDDELREYLGAATCTQSIADICEALGLPRRAQAWLNVNHLGAVLAVTEEWLRRKTVSSVAAPNL